MSKQDDSTKLRERLARWGHINHCESRRAVLDYGEAMVVACVTPSDRPSLVQQSTEVARSVAYAITELARVGREWDDLPRFEREQWLMWADELLEFIG